MTAVFCNDGGKQSVNKSIYTEFKFQTTLIYTVLNIHVS